MEGRARECNECAMDRKIMENSGQAALDSVRKSMTVPEAQPEVELEMEEPEVKKRRSWKQRSGGKREKASETDARPGLRHECRLWCCRVRWLMERVRRSVVCRETQS